MGQSSYAPAFPLKYALKDMLFALEEARGEEADAEGRGGDANEESAEGGGVDEEDRSPLLPVSAAATALFEEAQERGRPVPRYALTAECPPRPMRSPVR